MAKTLPIPNIHPGCRVRIIDYSADRPVWKTIGECFDAPNPIAELLKQHNLSGAWVFDCLGDRRYVTTI